MQELRWEQCRDNHYAGYDGHEFVALLKPVVFEREGRGPLTGAQVFEEAWTWEMYDTEMDIPHWGEVV